MNREKVWAEEFKSYVVELQLFRDDYKGIIEYIDEGLALLNEQEHKDRMFHALEDDWKRLKELLKEQEAVEPTLIREGRNKNYNDYVCPRCDNEVVYEQNYCSECGVQFLWEGR